VILCARWLGEGPSLLLIVVREVVVDDDCSLLSIYEQLDCVAAGVVDLLDQEDPLDALRELGQG